MSDELPKGWATAALSQLTENPKQDIISGPFGSNLKSDEYVSEGVPIIRLQNVDRNKFLEKNMRFITPQKARELSAHNFRAGDVVISKLGDPLGKACAIPESLPHGIVVADVVRVRIDENRFSKSYTLFAINSPAVANQINSEMMGSTRPRVNLNNIRDLQIPLAPLAEQRRIVAKLEKLLGQVDACQQRLEKMPTLLKRFRQSILAAACSGRLTADWREENSDVESARSLIERIVEVRKKSPKAQEVELIPEGESPDDIVPTSWEWVRFGSVIGELRNGVPLRPNIEPPGVPILRISAARPGAVNLDDFRFMPDGEQFVPQFTLRDNDVIFTRYNGTIEFLGTCGMVRGLGKKTLLYPDKLMRVRFDHGSILPAYAEVFFQAPHVHERVVARSKSSAGQNGISGSDIKGQPFALPPLAEQQEIVRRVAGLFALADQLEQRLAQARKQVDKLTPSLLARAFAGQLVPQNPTDEPAEKLLERITKQPSDS